MSRIDSAAVRCTHFDAANVQCLARCELEFDPPCIDEDDRAWCETCDHARANGWIITLSDHFCPEHAP
jgi:hypothetical protein